MSEMTVLLKEFIEETTRMLVDIPDEVDIGVAISTKAIIVQLRVSKSDCGKVIGKKGRTIDALKILCLAIKNTNFPEDSRRILLEVLEDEDSDYSYR